MFVRVAPTGPGEVLGTAILADGQVTYTGTVAEDTFAMLAGRFHRTPAEIFQLMHRDGWSNGSAMAVTPPP